MSTARSIFAMVAALSAGAACTDDLNTPTGGGARPGVVILHLATPNADDGAVLFEVSGAAIDSAVAINASLRLFTRRVGDSTVVGALAGAVATGAVVRLYVADVVAAAASTVRVLEVADRQDALRSSLTGYALAVIP